MEDKRAVIKDRLEDRGLVDQWGFVLFAVLGGVGIVATKFAGAPELFVAAGAVLALVTYAALVARSGSGRLRSDQAGDNCYYLGLIYTLSSLAYAIVTFDPMGTATAIIQGFGIALATTIVGLVLRVFFSQGRPDLEDFEEQARLEIANAVGTLKTELSQSVRMVNDLNRQIIQSISEAREAATKDITNFAKEASTDLKAVISTARQAVETEAADFTARAERFGTTIDNLVLGLERHDATLARLLAGQQGLATTTEAIQTSAGQAQAVVAQLAWHSENVGQAIDAISRSAHEIGTSVTSLVTEVSLTLAELREAPGAAIENASNMIVEAAQLASSEVSRIAKSHGELATQLTSQTQLAVDTSRSNNAALSEQLERSRELLEKVHLELVAITGELVRRVEERR